MRHKKKPESVVILFVVVMLLCGWILKSTVEDPQKTLITQDFTVSYPADWLKRAESSSSAFVTGGMNIPDNNARPTVKGETTIAEISSLSGTLDITIISGQLGRFFTGEPPNTIVKRYLEYRKQLYNSKFDYFTYIDTRYPAETARPVVLEYAYVRQKQSAMVSNILPEVIRVREYIFIRDSTAYIFRFNIPKSVYEDQLDTVKNMIHSISWNEEREADK